MGWVRVDATGTTEGTLEGAGGSCTADPAWSPDGQSLWWIDQDMLHVQRWGPTDRARQPAGVLHLAGYGDRGSVSALAVSIETHHVPGVPGYDRIVLPEGAVAEPQLGVLRAHSHPLRSDFVAPAYTLQRTPGEDGND